MTFSKGGHVPYCKNIMYLLCMYIFFGEYKTALKHKKATNRRLHNKISHNIIKLSLTELNREIK